MAMFMKPKLSTMFIGRIQGLLQLTGHDKLFVPLGKIDSKCQGKRLPGLCKIFFNKNSHQDVKTPQKKGEF